MPKCRKIQLQFVWCCKVTQAPLFMYAHMLQVFVVCVHAHRHSPAGHAGRCDHAHKHSPVGAVLCRNTNVTKSIKRSYQRLQMRSTFLFPLFLVRNFYGIRCHSGSFS
jgi:hypothetical protein